MNAKQGGGMTERLRVPRLETEFGGGTVLEKAGVDVRIDRLFSIVKVEQAWRNPTKRNFEVVYTFPVSPGATLLEFEVRIGDRRLAGLAVERDTAAERYEEAVTERRRAVLLEEAEDGLYTVSIGNLGPGETVVVRYACAEVLRRQGEAVRFCLPTVIAPRYGVTQLEPHQEPEYDLLDGPERKYALAVTVSGPLADAEWQCPTHEVRRRRVKDGLRIALVRPALMDRDFVLECRDPGAGVGAVLDRDCDGWTVLASFRPEGPGSFDEGPRAL
ncbi:MAG TPA: hypothetical protein ENN51_03180, partial [candidate division WOR-3 bacterium]|nr:hypothetical protein [candidate division WOR-3 bacterium]